MCDTVSFVRVYSFKWHVSQENTKIRVIQRQDPTRIGYVHEMSLLQRMEGEKYFMNIKSDVTDASRFVRLVEYESSGPCNEFYGYHKFPDIIQRASVKAVFRRYL